MKPKFEHQTKIGTPVYSIHLNIVPNPRYTSRVNSYDSEGIFIEKLKIVYQTERRLALSDNYITVLDRRYDGERLETYRSYLEEISVNIKTKERYFNNGIFAHVYTLQDPEKIIKKMTSKIASKIKNEYGFLNNIDVFEKVESLTVTNN